MLARLCRASEGIRKGLAPFDPPPIEYVLLVVSIPSTQFHFGTGIHYDDDAMSFKTLAIIAGLLFLGFGFNIYQKSRLPDTALIPVDAPVSQHAPLPETLVTVHVAGAVRNPGMYRLSPQMRVSDAIAKAGGVRGEVNFDKLNLAAKLKDGQRILVTERKKATKKQQKAQLGTPVIVNLNHAGVESLRQLPGMSLGMAKAIVAFRDRQGPFVTIDTLTEIKGIGPKTVEKWSPYLRL